MKSNTQQPTGSIQRRANGKYTVRLSFPDKGRRSIGTYDTLVEAKQVLAAVLEELAGTRSEPGTKETLTSYGYRWIDRRDQLGVVCAKNERQNWTRYVDGTKIGNMSPQAIKRADVREWLEDVQMRHPIRWHKGKRQEDTTKRISEQVAKHQLRLLRQVLQHALEDSNKPNPAVAIQPRKQARTHDKWNYLTPDEQRQLLESIPMPDRCIVAFAMGTGLRISEQWSLRIEDVHADIERPYIDVRFGGRNKATKARKPRRVPLFGLALQAWHAWQEHLSTIPNTENIVFPTSAGVYRGRKTPRGWAKWLKKSGIQKHVRWHDLRHTCASSLVAGWWGRRWTLAETRDFLGHSSVTVTERYAHLTADVLGDAARETTSISTAALVLLTQPGGTEAGTDRLDESEKSMEIRRERETGFEPATSSLGSFAFSEQSQPLTAHGSTSVPSDVVGRISSRLRRRGVDRRSRQFVRRIVTSAFVGDESTCTQAMVDLGARFGWWKAREVAA